MKSVLKKYLNNELTPIKAERVEKQLLTQLLDKKQRNHWEHLLAAEGIERDSLPNEPKAVLQTAKIVSFNPRPMLWKAAVGAFLVVGSWFLMRPTSSNPVEAYAAEMQAAIKAPEVRMGSNPSAPELNWQQAKTAYAAKDFQKAGDELQKIVQTGNATTEQKYYLGLSRFFQQNPDYKAAIDAFLQVQKGGWIGEDEVNWLLALAYLKNGESQNAQKTLEALVAKNGYKATEARQLLKK
jgi:tetratricopeptide (TPR) repeat protein